MHTGPKLDYRHFGMFTSEIRKREQKYAEKVLKEEQYQAQLLKKDEPESV
jgi:hypothetical protein